MEIVVAFFKWIDYIVCRQIGKQKEKYGYLHDKKIHFRGTQQSSSHIFCFESVYSESPSFINNKEIA